MSESVLYFIDEASFFVLIILFCLIQAFRIKRNPDKVRAMRKVKEKQRGEEYEARMRTYFFFECLASIVTCLLIILICWLFGFDFTNVSFALIMVFVLILIIVKRHLTGEVYLWHWVLFALGIVVMIVFSFLARNDSKVEVQNEKLSMEIEFWEKVDYPSIDSVLVVDELPRTKYGCFEGYSYLGSKIGVFRLKDGSEAKFYVLNKKAPVLELYTQKGRYFVNRKTAAETEQLIEELRDKIGDKMKG
jgi:hypothetical protein